jgi:hypothetical protein
LVFRFWSAPSPAKSQAALAAVIVGMLFGFADNDGPLLGRLRLLLLDAGCITAGGLIGYFSRSDAAVLWPLFITITFAVGLAARTGREWLLAGRQTAMAFVVAAAVPSFSLLEVWYLLGVTLLAAATRSVDYLIAGPLPRQPAAPMQVPSGHAGWLRFAVAHAGAATAALWLGGTLDKVHTIWVVTTTLVVMARLGGTSCGRDCEASAGTRHRHAYRLCHRARGHSCGVSARRRGRCAGRRTEREPRGQSG